MNKLQKIVWFLQVCGHYTSFSSKDFLEEDFWVSGYKQRTYRGGEATLKRLHKEVITARILCGCKSPAKLQEDWADKCIEAAIQMLKSYCKVYTDYEVARCYKTAVQRFLNNM